MKIYLATDHAGFELKEKVKEFLKNSGYQVEDLGTFEYKEDDDYPDWIKLAAEAVSKCAQDHHSHPERSEGSRDSSAAPQNDNCRAIVFGGSGQGEAMVANRFKDVRATVLYKFDKEIIKLSREHNDANVLSIGARFLSPRKAIKAIQLWLATPFSDEERHRRRIAKF